MKFCKKCSRELPKTEFHKTSRNKDGFSIWCKACKKIIAAAYRKKHAKILNTKDKEKYSANPEKRLKRMREQYARLGYEKSNKRNQLQRDRLDESYIRCLLIRGKAMVSRNSIPSSLVEAKRLQILIKRHIERNTNEKC